MVHLVGGDVASSSMESVELMISIPEVKQKHFVLQKAGTRKGGIMEISSLITTNFVFIKGFQLYRLLEFECAKHPCDVDLQHIQMWQLPTGYHPQMKRMK